MPVGYLLHLLHLYRRFCKVLFCVSWWHTVNFFPYIYHIWMDIHIQSITAFTCCIVELHQQKIRVFKVKPSGYVNETRKGWKKKRGVVHTRFCAIPGRKCSPREVGPQVNVVQQVGHKTRLEYILRGVDLPTPVLCYATLHHTPYIYYRSRYVG